MTRLAVILIGPQGSGKGTQSQILRKSHHFSYIAGGNIARELAKKQSELGHEVREIMNEGHLLPDRILNEGVASIIRHASHHHLLFDGYPRNLSQATFVADYLQEHHFEIIIIELDLDDKTSIDRIKKRFICSHCGSIIYTYAKDHLTPLQKLRQLRKICIHCGGKLVQRSDDTEDSVKKRLNLYHKETTPVIDYFKNHQFKVYSVDAKPSVEIVTQDVQKVIHEYI